eukprot:4981521-Amphidinium_carterae.1
MLQTSSSTALLLSLEHSQGQSISRDFQHTCVALSWTSNVVLYAIRRTHVTIAAPMNSTCVRECREDGAPQLYTLSISDCLLYTPCDT